MLSSNLLTCSRSVSPTIMTPKNQGWPLDLQGCQLLCLDLPLTQLLDLHHAQLLDLPLAQPLLLPHSLCLLLHLDTNLNSRGTQVILLTFHALLIATTLDLKQDANMHKPIQFARNTLVSLLTYLNTMS